MLIKKFDKEGKKYYMDVFTGKVVELQYKSPIKVYVKKENSDEITYGALRGFSFSNKGITYKRKENKNSKMKSYTFELNNIKITKKAMSCPSARAKAKRVFDKRFGEWAIDAIKLKHYLKPASTNIHEYKLIF